MINQLKDIDPIVLSVLAVSLPALLLLLFNFLLSKKVSSWEDESRGFKAVSPYWRRVFYSSWLGGWVAGIVALVVSNGNIYATFIFAVTAYVLIFSSITDTIVHKAPKEVAHYGILSLLPISALALLNGGLFNLQLQTSFAFLGNRVSLQLFSAGVWFAILLLIMVISRGGLGMADFRLFLLFGIGLSWWVGIMGMVVLFFIANVLQIIVFFPAKKFKWGHMIKLSNGKERWAVPFIPVISIAFMVGAFIYLSQATM